MREVSYREGVYYIYTDRNLYGPHPSQAIQGVVCAPPPPQQPLPLLRPVCTAAGVLGSGQHFWQRSRSQFQDCTTCRLKRLTQRGATPPHPSPWRAERAAGARLRGDAVVGPATVHGIWTAIPRRPGVFVILGSRNVPAQATDPPGARAPSASRWEGRAGSELIRDAVARHGLVNGVRTAILRRSSVFVILGSRNVPAQATDSQARARPAPVALHGGLLRT